jgi:hypothetical protein
MTTLFLTAGAPFCHGKADCEDYMLAAKTKMFAMIARQKALKAAVVDPTAIYAARRAGSEPGGTAKTRPTTRLAAQMPDPAAVYARRKQEAQS